VAAPPIRDPLLAAGKRSPPEGVGGTSQGGPPKGSKFGKNPLVLRDTVAVGGTSYRVDHVHMRRRQARILRKLVPYLNN